MKKIMTTVLLSILFMLSISQVSFAQSQTTYTVQPGDSLWEISVKYQVGLSEIIDANPQFDNPNLIYPGQKVIIPKITKTKNIEQQVIQLTNQERKKHGLKPLQPYWELSRVARYKSRDMRDQKYFSHYSPLYGSPFNMMKNFGISYRSAAENIAAGQRSPREVVNAWMNSSGHRKNILNPRMTHIGVGYAKGGSYGHYWTQQFIQK